MKEAREKLVYYNMTPTERAAYDRHVDAIMIQNDVLDTAKWEGRLEGLAEGKAEGEAKLRQTAINMKRIGMPTADIATCTGLSAEEIEKL